PEAARETETDDAALEPSPGELHPLPDLSGLPGLAGNAAGTGVTVSLDLAGTGAVPAGVGLSAYRIVQEAITNVVKHAAPGCSRSSRSGCPTRRSSSGSG